VGFLGPNGAGKDDDDSDAVGNADTDDGRDLVFPGKGFGEMENELTNWELTN